MFSIGIHQSEELMKAACDLNIDETRALISRGYTIDRGDLRTALKATAAGGRLDIITDLLAVRTSPKLNRELSDDLFGASLGAFDAGFNDVALEILIIRDKLYPGHSLSRRLYYFINVTRRKEADIIEMIGAIYKRLPNMIDSSIMNYANQNGYNELSKFLANLQI